MPRGRCTTYASPRMPPTGCWERLATSIWPIFHKWSRVRQLLLEKARAGYQQFMVEEGDDLLVGWGAVRAQVRLGDIQALQGDAPKAEASYRAAGRELEKLAKLDASTEGIRRDLARDLQGLGVLLKDANRFQEGEAELREAIKLREEILNLPDATADDKQARTESRTISWGRCWLAAAVKISRPIKPIKKQLPFNSHS